MLDNTLLQDVAHGRRGWTAALLDANIHCGRHKVVLVTGANITCDVLSAACSAQADPSSV